MGDCVGSPKPTALFPASLTAMRPKELSPTTPSGAGKPDRVTCSIGPSGAGQECAFATGGDVGDESDGAGVVEGADLEIVDVLRRRRADHREMQGA